MAAANSASLSAPAECGARTGRDGIAIMAAPEVLLPARGPALSAVDGRLCHRDLHPGSFIVDTDGTLLRIIDWDTAEAWDPAGDWFKLEFELLRISHSGTPSRGPESGVAGASPSFRRSGATARPRVVPRRFRVASSGLMTRAGGRIGRPTSSSYMKRKDRPEPIKKN